jgi:hypothetical protein
MTPPLPFSLAFFVNRKGVGVLNKGLYGLNTSPCIKARKIGEKIASWGLYVLFYDPPPSIGVIQFFKIYFGS